MIQNQQRVLTCTMLAYVQHGADVRYTGLKYICHIRAIGDSRCKPMVLHMSQYYFVLLSVKTQMILCFSQARVLLLLLAILL
jgi:hypothetical protein